MDTTDGDGRLNPVTLSRRLLSGPALVAYLALLKLLLHFATNGQYGYHSDEFWPYTKYF